jgi:2-polyprenyl-3-methyl-5-hydroxy-6-metoxy-1,4-benzoquinol methylase
VIVCPRCAAGLAESEDGFSCPSCPYRADREQGIVLFERGLLPDHADYESEGLDALYRHERDHPWFRHRLKLIRKAFAVHVGKHEDVLEVGAGTGHTARALREAGYGNLSLGEMHTRGLAYAKQYGLEKLYQFDLRSPPFRDHFDVVALFDVLEHINEDGLAVRTIRGMLRPGGRIVLTVPAHRWLWSRIDKLSGHHRRYDRKGLMSVLASAGFEVVECRYFFTALVPGLLVRSLLSRKVTWATVESGCGLNVSKLGNALLGLASGPGDALLSPLRNVTGGSLLAVARKR